MSDHGVDDLLARKDALVLELADRLVRLGLPLDYAIPVMRSAGTLPPEERIAVLEALVEIEALKYTLAARRVRELEDES
jgi:hypothetical protein